MSYRKFFQTILAAVLIFGCTIMSAYAEEKLQVRTNIEIDSRQVLLEDILVDPGKVSSDIRSLEVKTIFRPGIQVLIHLEKVERMLSRAGHEYSLENGKRRNYIKVEVPMYETELDEINRRIAKGISRKFNLAGDEKLEFDWNYINMRLPEEYEVRLDRFSRKRGRIYASVYWKEVKLRTISGRVSVARKYSVLKSTKTLQRGSRIESGDVYQDEVYSSQRIQEIFPEEVIGKILKRSVRHDCMIQERNLKKAVLVEKGQRIRIKRVSGSLSIVLPGIALTAGGKKDLIKVRSLRAKNIYTCQILSKNKIEIL